MGINYQSFDALIRHQRESVPIEVKSPAGAPPVAPAWQRKGRLYVIGVDGMSPDVAGPMMERGELPTFSQLAREGCYGPLSTVRPTNSALIWTSIATGRHHDAHGIDGFGYYTILGRRISQADIRRHGWRGMRLLVSIAKALRLRKMHHFDGRHVRTKTFWDVVSESGGRIVVVNWWLTWPAVPVNGLLISDRVHYWRRVWRGAAPTDTGLTHPAELLDEMRELIVPPEQITAGDLQRYINLPEVEIRALTDAPRGTRNAALEVRFVLSKDTTIARLFQHCLDREPEAKLAAAYFRGPDNAQHCGYPYMPGTTDSGATPEERRAYGRIVAEVYKFADELVGSIVDRMGPQDSLLVMSDHGYGAQPGYKHPYGHARGEPPGVIFAMGPELRSRAAVSGASIYDVFPTAMRLTGFPSAQDSTGRCLEELLRPEWVREHPPLAPIPTYGPRLARHDTVRGSRQADKALTEDLRALGYLE